MPRVDAAVVKEREAYMLEIFKQNPTLSAGKANEKFKEKFKTMMRNKRVYELRRLATDGNKPVADPTASLARRGTARGDAQKAALITGSSDELMMLRRAVDKIRNSGLASLRVDHETPSYLVVAAE